MIKTITFLSFCSLSVHAQQVLASSGDTYTKPSASLSWTLGEISTETYKTVGGIATQGIQQPLLKVVTYSSETTLQVSAVVYPNPTSGAIQLSFQEQNPENLAYSLCQLNGVEILKGEIETATSLVDLGTLPNATYLLKINKDGKAQKTFKIIKQ